MNKKVILLISAVALFMSCNQAKKGSFIAMTTQNNYNVVEANQEQSEGYTLMKTYCYVCHNPNTKSHDDVIAPPFKGVKMHYTRQYDNKKDFVDAMVSWVQNPDENKALMRGAVNKFEVMVKLPLPTADLKKIAEYIYDNDVEEPEWMEAHMKENQGGKMGKGKGQNKNNKNKECNHKEGESCGNNC